MKTKVKELRAEHGMTQQQLADLVGVSSRTIISIEKGQYSPSLMLAYRMARVFGVSVEELCCLEENLEMEGGLCRYIRSGILSSAAPSRWEVFSVLFTCLCAAAWAWAWPRW